MTRVIKAELRLLTGRAHPKLAQAVARRLDTKLTPVSLEDFANGEIGCRISESLRGDDVFVIQPHGGENVNVAIMEQAIIIDAAKRASARSITAVCPVLGYSRQDRKSDGREPITARLVVDILGQAGADRIMTVDLHSGQIQGFFNGPFDHLIAMPILVDYIRSHFKPQDLVIVSPDAGRAKLTERYVSEIGCDIALVHKHRSTKKRNTVEARYLIGDAEGKICIIIDDMIDTAGTICASADLLAKRGAKAVYGVATHGMLSGPAYKRIDKSAFKKVIVTDTLPLPKKSRKVQTLSVAPLIADAIAAVHRGQSVSALFDGKNQI